MIILAMDKCFQILRKHGIHLNPSKYAFRVSLGQFLGCMVIKRVIEVNLIQINTLAKVKIPEIACDV